MWKSYPEFDRTVDGWIIAMYDSKDRAYTIRCLQRVLKRATSEHIITKAEEKSLWSMLRASEEDAYVALSAIENKYKQLTKPQRHEN